MIAGETIKSLSWLAYGHSYHYREYARQPVGHHTIGKTPIAAYGIRDAFLPDSEVLVSW
jgi:hypothetical protein